MGTERATQWNRNENYYSIPDGRQLTRLQIVWMGGISPTDDVFTSVLEQLGEMESSLFLNVHFLF